MKKSSFISTSRAAMAAALLGAFLATPARLSAATDDDKVVVPDSTGFTFTDVKLVKTTPVKDQNKSGTCWSFAGLSFLEDEILNKTGREVDLSEMFVVRNCYDAKADRFIRHHGECNLTSGGGLMDVPFVWETVGIVPEEAYTGLNYGEEKHVHGELDAGLRSYLDAIVANPNGRLSTNWKAGANGILDAYLGSVPATFTVDGKTYTPRSYADALGLKMDDYVAFTSFTHKPFGKPFVLDVPDNWVGGLFQNVPMEKLKQIVDASLEAGHSVLWAADVSEGGFKWRKGYAVMPKGKDTGEMDGTELSRWVQLSDKDRRNEKYEISGPVEEEVITQESRQAGYDRWETTDDHAMVIIGTATDQNGTRYYKVKNSWDTNQLYGGYIYVSEPYFLAKTVGILVNKNTLPK